MGRRLRSIPVQLDNQDNIQITRHAIERFRKRVSRISPGLIPATIARMMRQVTEIPCPKRHDDGKRYLKHHQCTFVMTHRGVIITVLTPPRPPSTSRKKPTTVRHTGHPIRNDNHP